MLQRYLEKVREQGVPTLSGSDADDASPATALTTSAVPTPVEAVPVPEASRAVVSAPAASRRLPSRKRKNEARNVSPDAVPADDLRTCETCCLEFPVSETIRCIAKSDCCSPPGWVSSLPVLLNGHRTHTDTISSSARLVLCRRVSKTLRATGSVMIVGRQRRHPRLGQRPNDTASRYICMYGTVNGTVMRASYA